ncbi:MAG: ArsA family ATPase [Desulfatibacillaceae bacterium]
MMGLDRLLAEKRILICGGSGGVGKTTISAALALKAAMAGRKVLVCTIDPAQRLADSLGLENLGNAETDITEEVVKATGNVLPGQLWAMMLDSKRTFDALIERIAPNSEVAGRVLGNQFYQNVTTALAGSQEFSAMEKLYELDSRGDYDLIVLDTPPTRHALDFIDAPGKLTAFLDARVIQWFVKPYLAAEKVGFKFFNRSAKVLFRILEKGTGYQTLADIADFFLVFEGMYDGFKMRAEKVRSLISSHDSAFVLVTSPQFPSLTEAKNFLARMKSEDLALGEIIFNRVYMTPGGLPGDRLRSIKEEAMSEFPGYSDVVETLCDNLRLFIILSEADQRAVDRFLEANALGGRGVRVPYLPRDVHDISGLAVVAGHIEG